MAEIQIQIEAYGAVSAQLPEYLSVRCLVKAQVGDVLEQLVQQHPQAQHLIEQCACAIGEDIVPRSFVLSQDVTLVLLSPVAGG
ncbi:MoaD/ThiS family protein [Acinetobacter sp. MD2]|uniref:MoaD/ThiS family protein n=1 Tax=Acinetobacter sp. MD2 TaxID=2600066 RepID=UPI002D1F168D|nr:MoaD/ThiS family protein [Acinetobacter sp. MD2]MEB3766699.1 MoaD/ThiS family protein [Acinetobacter sp. MD2]